MGTPSARNWKSLIDLEELELDSRYHRAICTLAAIQANEEPREGADAPDISEPDEVIAAVTNGQSPSWWPGRIDRLSVTVKVKPEGSTPENLGPHPLDPNREDLGLGTFTGVLRGLLEMAGTPFQGDIQIRLQRKSDKSTLGGWKGEIYVGEKERKGKKKGGSDGDDFMLDRLEYLEEKAEKQDEAMLRMFQNAGNVIHASASAINAMRGANVAPPWMQGAGGEEEPFWMGLVRGATDMVIKAQLEDQSPAQAAGQLLRQPVRPQQHRMQGHPQHQLTGPAPQEPELGYNEYLEEGDFDGYRASERDLLEDGFDDEDEYYDDDEDFDDEEEEDPLDNGFEDSGEAFHDPTYDQDRRRSRRRRHRGKEGNPLEGLNPDEIADVLGEYIDNNPGKKGELKGLAMRLAGKLM